MELPRTIGLPGLLEKKSFFLFGPRATGKSTLIGQQLSGSSKIIDLLDSRLFLKLSASPFELESLIDGMYSDDGSDSKDVVVIDEVQRVPELLNEVHRLIETRGIRFLLTGSSTRKLRRGNVNLLAGRAWQAQLFPFTSFELENLDLDRYLLFGGLPSVYSSDYPVEELDAYVNTYLREEILAEGLIRKLPPFSRFLRSMALSSGNMINFAKLGNDCQVPPSTVVEYVGILEDTLVGFMLPAWTESKKRKAIRTGKFYFFDTGVTHILSGTKSLDRNSDLWGKSFEQFIAMELRAWLSYRRIKVPLTYWRSVHGNEVDFLIGEETAIEVKSSSRITSRDTKGLKALCDEGVFRTFLLVSNDPVETKKDGIHSLHWKTFIKNLWMGKYD